MDSDFLTHNTPRLRRLLQSGYTSLLTHGLKGIEKESLRIADNGFIAQTPHPKALGSALTHPYITTDYSEALLEFITPPFTDIRETLAFLDRIHRFVYQNIGDELLLATSMPCGIDGDQSIPIARYGSSNIGRMKHIYRRGLAYRYGRTMQSIAGIHFNYSIPEKLWPVLKQLDDDQRPLEEYIADAYFGLIRNFQRQGWILLYLFGASPAICKTFFKSRPQYIKEFDAFDPYTLFHPYATSLRMSDIGYKSVHQADLKIDYNSLEGYVRSLSQAISTPCAEYAEIGVKVNGEYRQLNSNALQIENEYYSTIRPKQIAQSCEKPTLALKCRGVRYVEIRCIDLNLFEPTGINENTTRFTEALLITCLLQKSPQSSSAEQRINNENQLAVAHQGRKPGLLLQKGEEKLKLTDWANEIIQIMRPVCEILDRDLPDRPYTQVIEQQKQRIDNPELTPSAQILAGMRRSRQAFAPFALHISEKYQRQFKNNPLTVEQMNEFRAWSKHSLDKQQELENSDQCPFDNFLAHYFAQS